MMGAMHRQHRHQEAWKADDGDQTVLEWFSMRRSGIKRVHPVIL